MGIFDKLFNKKSLRLGKLVVPFKDLRTHKLDEEDFMCVGDTKEAAYEFLQYVCEVAHIKKDVDSAVSFLEEIYNFTKKIYQSWEWDKSKQEPWMIGTWSSPVFSQSVRPYISREWAWATYILKQWGDKRAIPVLKQLCPLLDFWRRARVKRLICQFS